MSAFYPRDLSAKVDEDLLRYGYPLYASQSFWYYNTEAFPDGQPVTSWWQIIEKNEDSDLSSPGSLSSPPLLSL